ncbi:MAG TPA: TIGR03668 family PPOX class F420-dependent oxidoreductase [Mycobacteriales bacterium]|nr:TIGR03668 family PPOX class F420-dependent oxidoreductase [Mycobacteriales bacterium]
MTSQERQYVERARVARLATVRPDGTPHVVAVTFAVHGGTVVTAVDDKPKRSEELQRLRNLEERPAAALLVDHYDDDWSKLWWVRLDGVAEVVRHEPRRTTELAPLVAKYPQYRESPPRGPVIVMTVRSATSWSAG